MRLVLAAAVIGALIAVPAHGAAGTLTVTGTAVCNSETGDWHVQWRIVPVSATQGRITALLATPVGSILTDLAIDDVIGPTGRGPESADQRVPAGATSASLTVTALFLDGPAIDSGTVTIPGTCGRPLPSVSFTSTCTGLTARLVNAASATADAMFTVIGTGFSRAATVAPGGARSVTAPASAVRASGLDVRIGGLTFATGSWNPPTSCTAPTTAPPPAGNPGPSPPLGGGPPRGTPASSAPPAPIVSGSPTAFLTAAAAAAMGSTTGSASPTVAGPARSAPGLPIGIILGVLMLVGGAVAAWLLLRRRRAEPQA